MADLEGPPSLDVLLSRSLAKVTWEEAGVRRGMIVIAWNAPLLGHDDDVVDRDRGRRGGPLDLRDTDDGERARHGECRTERDRVVGRVDRHAVHGEGVDVCPNLLLDVQDEAVPLADGRRSHLVVEVGPIATPRVVLCDVDAAQTAVPGRREVDVERRLGAAVERSGGEARKAVGLPRIEVEDPRVELE